MEIARVIKDFVYKFQFLTKIGFYIKFKYHFKRLININNYDNCKYPGEENYKKKWKQLSKRIEPYSYRFFSHYCGLDPDIIPEDIGQTIIQEKLSPTRYRPFYSDKNLYASYLDLAGGGIPKTIVCRINNSRILDNEFKPINKSIDEILSGLSDNIKKLVLKPSNDSNSGSGVILFVRDFENKWKNHINNDYLREEFLENYGSDWVLQEGIFQHSFLSQFCNSSVNTFRICAYRSFKTEEVHIPSAVLRIGKAGSCIDNACAGGKFVGIDVKTGKLGKYACDKNGSISDSWNNVNFKENEFIIPNWEKVVEFAKSIVSQNYHCRAIGLDITLNDEGLPIMLEYNVDYYSYWLFKYTGQKVFGEYLDEIIEYCRKK